MCHEECFPSLGGEVVCVHDDNQVSDINPMYCAIEVVCDKDANDWQDVDTVAYNVPAIVLPVLFDTKPSNTKAYFFAKPVTSEEIWVSTRMNE